MASAVARRSRASGDVIHGPSGERVKARGAQGMQLLLRDTDGSVGKLVNSVAQQVFLNARRGGDWARGGAPVGRSAMGDSDFNRGQTNRGGNLRKSHVKRTKKTRKGPGASVVNTAPYAAAVYLGTKDGAPITSNKLWGMVWHHESRSFPTKALEQNLLWKVGNAYEVILKNMVYVSGTGRFHASIVRGQDAKPWLACGYNQVAGSLVYAQFLVHDTKVPCQSR